jgi:hypothetical protein
VGTVDLRRAVFVLTSQVGEAALAMQGVTNLTPHRATQAAGGGAAAESGTDAVIEVIRTETRAWAAARPALGGRLSNSQVPFV